MGGHTEGMCVSVVGGGDGEIGRTGGRRSCGWDVKNIGSQALCHVSSYVASASYFLFLRI